MLYIIKVVELARVGSATDGSSYSNHICIIHADHLPLNKQNYDELKRVIQKLDGVGPVDIADPPPTSSTTL